MCSLCICIISSVTLHSGALQGNRSIDLLRNTHLCNFIGSKGNGSLCCLNTCYLLIALLRPLYILRYHTFTYHRCTDILPPLVKIFHMDERLKQMIGKRNFLKKWHSRCSSFNCSISLIGQLVFRSHTVNMLFIHSISMDF